MEEGTTATSTIVSFRFRSHFHRGRRANFTGRLKTASFRPTPRSTRAARSPSPPIRRTIPPVSVVEAPPSRLLRLQVLAHSRPDRHRPKRVREVEVATRLRARVGRPSRALRAGLFRRPRQCRPCPCGRHRRFCGLFRQMETELWMSRKRDRAWCGRWKTGGRLSKAANRRRRTSSQPSGARSGSPNCKRIRESVTLNLAIDRACLETRRASHAD